MKLFLQIVLFVISIATSVGLQAQCAMCRTQVVNNVSHGDASLAAGLNTGILYLFFTPYVAIAVVAFFWYRNAKINERKRSVTSHY